jgi:hypothetical protein
MTDAKYLAITSQLVPYVFPVPPPLPVLVGNTIQREQQRLQLKEATDLYNDARQLQTQLRHQLVQAVPPVYIAKLKQGDLGLANVTPKEILEHLDVTYGTIQPRDLASNLKTLRTLWNPEEPIETVFTNGDECRAFAILGLEPIPDGPYIRILVETFEQSGVLQEAIKDWNKLKPADQTLAACVDHFTRANETRADSTTSMQNVLAALPTIAPIGGGFPPTNGSLDGFYYCWTHGISLHPGTACQFPAEGHVSSATLKDRKGGSQDLLLGPYRHTDLGQYIRPERGSAGRGSRGGRGGRGGRGRNQDHKKRKTEDT